MNSVPTSVAAEILGHSCRALPDLQRSRRANTGLVHCNTWLVQLGQTLKRNHLMLSADQITTDEHEANSHALLQHLCMAQRFLSHSR